MWSKARALQRLLGSPSWALRLWLWDDLKGEEVQRAF